MGEGGAGFVQMGVERGGNITEGQANMFSILQREKGYEADVRQSKIDARQMEMQADQREADRKYRLAKALASQNAMTGVRGIQAFQGSPLTTQMEDVRMEGVATQRDRFESEMAQFTRQARARIARDFGQAEKQVGMMATRAQAFA